MAIIYSVPDVGRSTGLQINLVDAIICFDVLPRLFVRLFVNSVPHLIPKIKPSFKKIPQLVNFSQATNIPGLMPKSDRLAPGLGLSAKLIKAET
jgi:hypothetical protein